MMWTIIPKIAFETGEDLGLMFVPLRLMGSKKYEIDTCRVRSVCKSGNPFAPAMGRTEVKLLNQGLKLMSICLALCDPMAGGSTVTGVLQSPASSTMWLGGTCWMASLRVFQTLALS